MALREIVRGRGALTMAEERFLAALPEGAVSQFKENLRRIADDCEAAADDEASARFKEV
jgi:hypothetical protein